jgi:hypothetical protein
MATCVVVRMSASWNVHFVRWNRSGSNAVSERTVYTVERSNKSSEVYSYLDLQPHICSEAQRVGSLPAVL